MLFWFGIDTLGIVIAMALICNFVAAALAGILIPLALSRWGFDPAVSSGVFVTMVTDVVGLLRLPGAGHAVVAVAVSERAPLV